MQPDIDKLLQAVQGKILGQRDAILKTIISIICNGHILIEDVPGIGKTQLVLSLAQAVDAVFHRAQMTPDMMPSDITGFMMISGTARNKTFTYHEGVAMCNFLLVDEINRASPKVQSALLEIMEERQITLDNETHELPSPFITFATQNPVESTGTYKLPEAQMDRFFMRISLGYPSPDSEKLILDNNREISSDKPIDSVLTLKDIIRMQQEVEKIQVSEELKNYIMAIVHRTRSDENILLGISPRGSIALYKAAKGMAYVQQRNYATPNDVRDMAEEVLAHRLILNSKGKSTYEDERAYMKQILMETNPVMQGFMGGFGG